MHCWLLTNVMNLIGKQGGKTQCVSFLLSYILKMYIYMLYSKYFFLRVKAKDLIDFIQDDNRLREERKKAKKNKDKYVGVSSESMGFRGSGNSKCLVLLKVSTAFYSL